MLHNKVKVSALRQGAFIALAIATTKVIALIAQGKAAQHLGPEFYGISGIFLSLLPLITLMSNMQIDPLIVRTYVNAQSKNTQNDLIEHVFSLRMLVSLSLMVLLFAASALIGHKYALCFLLAAPFYFSQTLKPGWLLQAAHKLHIHYIGMLIQTATTAACIFVFFEPGQALGSDLICYSIGGGLAFLFTWNRAHGAAPKIKIKRVFSNESIDLIRSAKPLIGIATCSILFNSAQIPLVASLASTTEAGFYRTAALLSDNIYTTLFTVNALLLPHMVKWYQAGKKNFLRRCDTVIQYSLLLSLLCGLACYALTPLIYRLIYSEAYAAAIPEFKLLLIAKLILFTTGTHMHAFIGASRERELFKSLAIATAVGLLLSYASTQIYSTIGTATAELTYATSCLVIVHLKWRRLRLDSED